MSIAVHLLVLTNTKRVWQAVEVIPPQVIYGMSRQVAPG